MTKKNLYHQVSVHLIETKRITLREYKNQRSVITLITISGTVETDDFINNTYNII